ncbi:NAD(+) diphosphatase [Nakamurella deserti]|uniref:NAD(+) diphosphatase n=1 Tax=Nakamurella deserti TaxID=2164074 RepID=UPI00197C620B
MTEMAGHDGALGTQGLGEVDSPPLAAGASIAGWLTGGLTPTLSRGTADRGEDFRSVEHTTTAWPRARVLVVDPDGRVAADTDGNRVRLRYRPATEFGGTPPADAVHLGVVDGGDVWAVPGAVEEQPAERSDGWGRTGGGLRQWGEVLDDTEAGLLTSAVAVLTWHRLAPFCPRCGEPNRPTTVGWSRTCPNDHLEFPRTDPAVIMLVHDGADACVLARQPIWPANRYSILAGFTEAGESLEATVIREVREEVGLDVTEVRYLGSQPWPFPRSLMMGFAARAERGAALSPRAGEIESAQWVTREQVRAVLADEDAHPELGLPSGISIARQLIEAWARG